MKNRNYIVLILKILTSEKDGTKLVVYENFWEGLGDIGMYGIDDFIKHFEFSYELQKDYSRLKSRISVKDLNEICKNL